MNFSEILFVSDYDNTLTGERHLVPQENIEAIRAFAEAGGAFTIASGRGKREWRESFEGVPVNAPFILGNGAVIYDSVADEVLWSSFIAEETQRKIIEMFDTLPEDCLVLIETVDRVYVPDEIYDRLSRTPIPFGEQLHPALQQIPVPWTKVTLASVELKPETMDLVQQELDRYGLSSIRSLPIMYEIAPENVDKGRSARRLMEMMGRRFLVAIGDAPNDLAMLAAADLAFVPEGSLLAEDPTFTLQHVRTVPCEQCAVADAIRILKTM
ncbi:MAG: Cof-type HAD-IIB family hydrolase [Clostridiales bacterium]|nr:Cof-type HAD-IIB family hydrolase [Clostridiales bacterium]